MGDDPKPVDGAALGCFKICDSSSLRVKAGRAMSPDRSAAALKSWDWGDQLRATMVLISVAWFPLKTSW
jgi:hypothetical protein